ncbi:MAG: phosphomannomutase/phosphoglucomutase, partial [Acidimicrobiales bacterium]|nr:phosphomannomutase/phosphoglucomutase [Acidimicrobiales bacterium]
ANGMGGLIAPEVFSKLPVNLDLLYGELDGSFPNHPADPIQAENLVDLARRVVETKSDVGLAFDGDADRVFLVDDLGQPLSGSTTTAIVAKFMLEKYPGSTVLHNLICSKSVPEIVRECGGTPIRTRVGHSFIKAEMAASDAVFGGEHSGHYYFRDNYRADSGIIAAMVVLSVLVRTGVSLSQLRREYERYSDSGEINTKVSNAKAVLDTLVPKLEEMGATIDLLDGVTADFGDWWCNIRPSNTEPLLRLNVEASNEDELQSKVSMIKNLIGSVSGDSSESDQ